MIHKGMRVRLLTVKELRKRGFTVEHTPHGLSVDGIVCYTLKEEQYIDEYGYVINSDLQFCDVRMDNNYIIYNIPKGILQPAYIDDIEMISGQVDEVLRSLEDVKTLIRLYSN